MKYGAQVIIKPQNGKVRLDWSYFTLMINPGDGGRLACWIPAFNIHYSAADEESAQHKGKAMVHMFFDYFLLNNPKGIKPLALELHKLGFKNDPHLMKELVRYKIVPTKFDSIKETLAPDFEGAKAVRQEAKMEVAL